MAVNRLGNFYFVSLHGPEDRGSPPHVLREQTEIVQRPGFDGSAIIRLGEKGEPFTMRSFVDTTTKDAALALGVLYERSQGQGPFGLIWGGVNFVTNFNVVYVPIHVQVTKVRKLSTAIGGLYPPSLGCVECQWTLLPVAVAIAPPGLT